MRLTQGSRPGLSCTAPSGLGTAMRRALVQRLIVCGIVLFGTFRSSAAEPTYWQDVRPLLRKHCTVCHSVRTIKEMDVSAGLALDSYAAITKDPKNPIVVRGKAAESELIKRLHVADASKRMPLDADPLPAETIDVLTRWVNAGALEGEPGASATGGQRQALLASRERQRPEGRPSSGR